MATQNQVSDRFVKLFVHEMYAVLLVIGTAEIIFRKIPEDLNQPPWEVAARIAAAALALWVVVSYWWDWSDYIEKEIKTTKRELVIDFVSLINMELMFAYYDRVEILAALFVSLGCCDIFWVVNHLIDLKRAGRASTDWRWLLDKGIAIIIYVAVLVVTRTFSKSLNAFFFVILMATAFLLVRLVSFRQLRQIRGLIFRPARASDADQIVHLHNDNILNVRAGIERTGFLLGPVRGVDFALKAMADGSERYFVAIDESGENIIGYLATSETVPQEVLGGITWKSISDKTILNCGRVVYVAHIAVSSRNSSRGVGRFLYQNLYRTFPNAVFFAFIATQPYRNARSLAFHLRQGFKICGVFRAPDYLGLKAYESFMLLKDTFPSS